MAKAMSAPAPAGRERGVTHSGELRAAHLRQTLQSNDGETQRVATNLCSRQTRFGGALLRARSLSPVRYARQVPQVFGRFVEDPESVEDCKNASAQMHERLEYSMNKGCDTHVSGDKEEHLLMKEAELIYELGVQRSTCLLRTMSHNLERRDPAAAAPQPPQSSSLEPRRRIWILYRDEAIRAHFCKNTQQLIALVQNDPNTKTTSALITRKALSYRRVSLDRIGQTDTWDPTFGVSSFFGVE